MNFYKITDLSTDNGRKTATLSNLLKSCYKCQFEIMPENNLEVLSIAEMNIAHNQHGARFFAKYNEIIKTITKLTFFSIRTFPS